MFHTEFDKNNKIWSGINLPSTFNPNISVGHVILYALGRHSLKIVQINDETNIQLTSEYIRLKTVQAAQNLHTLGYRTNDVFGIMAKNSHHLAPIVFASFCMGCPINPLDPSFGRTEIMHMYAITKPKLVFCDVGLHDLVQSCLDDLNNDAKIFTFSGKTGDSMRVEDLFTETFKEKTYVVADINGVETMAAIICSSGSTGLPKGVRLSHAVLMNQACNVSNIFNENDVCLAFSSIYWISGLILLIGTAISSTCRLITTDPFTPQLVLNMIDEHRVTFFSSAAHQLVLMLKCEQFYEADLSSIRAILCGGSKLPASIASSITTYLPNGTVHACYGMSEFAGMISGNLSQTNDESVGKLMPQFHIKIIDENGNRRGIDEEGEICIKFKYHFLGYHGNEEATVNSMDDEGFLTTGDFGYFDKEGNLYFIDRKKDLLKYCGYQISPTEIEQFLIQNGNIKAICVVGIPDSIAGDLPAALIIRNDGTDISENEIDVIISNHFSDSKRLRGGIYFVDSFPLTASGKILRRKVKEIAIELYEKRNNN